MKSKFDVSQLRSCRMNWKVHWPKKAVTISEAYLSCCTGKVKNLPSLLASVKHSLSCVSCSSIDVRQIIKFCGWPIDHKEHKNYTSQKYVHNYTLYPNLQLSDLSLHSRNNRSMIISQLWLLPSNNWFLHSITTL